MLFLLPMHQNVFGGWALPGWTGELTALPDHILRRVYFSSWLFCHMHNCKNKHYYTDIWWV